MAKEPPHRHNGGPLSDDDRRKLWNHIRALEVLAEQKADIATDEKVRKELAKADGFDTNMIASVLKRRKIGEGETRTADEMIRIYEDALRDQGALPLEQTRDRTPPRRTTEEIAEALHGEALAEPDDDSIRSAAANLERLARDTGGTITISGAGGSVTFGDGKHDMPFDEQMKSARELVIKEQRASTSWLQREMRVGYNTAARLIETLQQERIVSAPDHVGRREVLQASADDKQPAPETMPEQPETGAAAAQDIFD